MIIVFGFVSVSVPSFSRLWSCVLLFLSESLSLVCLVVFSVCCLALGLSFGLAVVVSL